jgi:hypothetical protein
MTGCGLLASEPLPLLIVLYNGEHRWRKPEIERHQPELVSVLIDQGRFLAELLLIDAAPASLTTLLFRLDQADDLQALAEVAQAMASWLKQPEQQHLAASIGVWLRRVLLPPMATDVKWREIEDFSELTDMLQERVRRWPERWKQEGRMEGELAALTRLVQKRFGAQVAASTTRQLTETRDLRLIGSLMDAFLDCQTPEQWLEQLGRSLN